MRFSKKVCTSAILLVCGFALISAHSSGESALDDVSALEAITRSFIVSPYSFVYDKAFDLYFFVSRSDTRPLHEGGDRGSNNGQLSAFRPSLGTVMTADDATQNFGFCEEAHGTEIVGRRLYVAAKNQVCVFDTKSFEQLDSIGCCGASSAFDGHFLEGITWDPIRNMLWVTDLGAREQEVHNTGDDSDLDAGVTLDLNGKEMIAAIDFKKLNDDGSYEIRKTLGFSSTDSDSDSFSRTGEDPLDRTVRFHPAGIAVDPKTGLIFVANTIVKTQEDDEGENNYAAVWWCLPLGEAPCGSAECEGGFSETFDRTVSCNEVQSTRPIYKAGLSADGLVVDDSGNVIFTAWPSNVQSHKRGDDSDGFEDENHLQQPGKVFKIVGSDRNSVQYLTDGQSNALEAVLTAGPGCNSTACRLVEARVLVQRKPEGAIQLTYRVNNGEAGIEAGIHIHTGTSCSVPLGLFSSTNPNPWFTAAYKTDRFGNSEGTFEINTGEALEENGGHAVTIHDAKGAALACGVLGPATGSIPLIQPGLLTIDTKRNKLIIPSKDLFNTDSHTYYTVDLATATWEGWPVQTLETLISNPPLATIKEFSTSWLNTPNSITYDAKNDRYITTLGSENRLERKIKIREPDSPYEQNGQLSAWNAETSVLVSDLFGGCPQAWDSVVVDDLMYTASFMGWVCVMNLTDFSNGRNIGEKLLMGHNINGIAYDAGRNLLWVTESGTQGMNDRITHTLPSAPKETFTAMIVAIDLATRKVVAQTNVSNNNFFPVSLAVHPTTGNLIVGNVVAQLYPSDFGGLVECVPNEGFFVSCQGIPATAVISATNQFVLGVTFAADKFVYFSSMKPLDQLNPEANLFRLNLDGGSLETFQTDIFLPCRLETIPDKIDPPPKTITETVLNVATARTVDAAATTKVDARRKVRTNRGLLEDSNKAEDNKAEVNKYGTKETEDDDSDRWLNSEKGVEKDEEKLISNCVAAQVASHASFIYDSKRNALVFPSIVENSKFVVDLNTAKWVPYQPLTPTRLKTEEDFEYLDSDNDVEEDSNDHGVDIRERDRDIDSDAPDSDDDKEAAKKALKAEKAEEKKGIDVDIDLDGDVYVEIKVDTTDGEKGAVEEGAVDKEGAVDDGAESKEDAADDKENAVEDGADNKEDAADDKSDNADDSDMHAQSFTYDASEIFVPTRSVASVAVLTISPDSERTDLANASGIVKMVSGRDGSLVVTYSLVNIEANVVAGLHLHAGMACGEQGPLFFNASAISTPIPNDQNPWPGITYRSDSLGQAAGVIAVNTGIEYQDNVGHVFNVHDATGKSILCGVMTATEHSVAPLAPTAAAAAAHAPLGVFHTAGVTGRVLLTPVVDPIVGENPILLRWKFTGGKPSITGRIVIHDVLTCEGIESLQMGSLFQDGDHGMPFLDASFETDASGDSSGSAVINSGFGYAANVGKAVELHDDTGASVACGVFIPQLVQAPCVICIKPLDFRLDENSINDLDRDGESDSPCIDRDTDDSDCQTVDELREEDSDDFNESDEGKTDDDNHNEKRIPDSGWYMAGVFFTVSVLIAVFVKVVFIDVADEGANTEQHALLKTVKTEETVSAVV